jgi:hypothetical protein
MTPSPSLSQAVCQDMPSPALWLAGIAIVVLGFLVWKLLDVYARQQGTDEEP